MNVTLFVLGGSVISIVLAMAGFMVLARFSDGPRGPIPGGALEAGELVDATDVDWQQVLGAHPVVMIELQLESPVGSRTTGAFVHGGELYVPCDLGFVWRRMPGGVTRLLLHAIWLFKDWHEKAAIHGRVVIRTSGKRYKLQAVRVSDEALLRELRDHVSNAAEGIFKLLPVETDPRDIWFFRLEPRGEETS